MAYYDSRGARQTWPMLVFPLVLGGGIAVSYLYIEDDKMANIATGVLSILFVGSLGYLFNYTDPVWRSWVSEFFMYAVGGVSIYLLYEYDLGKDYFWITIVAMIVSYFGMRTLLSMMGLGRGRSYISRQFDLYGDYRRRSFGTNPYVNRPVRDYNGNVIGEPGWRPGMPMYDGRPIVY